MTAKGRLLTWSGQDERPFGGPGWFAHAAGMKVKLTRRFQTAVVNPLVSRHAGDEGNRYALLETTGRKSGLARQTPVGLGSDGGAYWIVSEMGRSAYYVRNLEANPHVRVRTGGRWRAGTAHVMPDDDPTARLSVIDLRTASEIGRMGTRLLSIRVDLES